MGGVNEGKLKECEEERVVWYKPCGTQGTRAVTMIRWTMLVRERNKGPWAGCKQRGTGTLEWVQLNSYFSVSERQPEASSQSALWEYIYNPILFSFALSLISSSSSTMAPIKQSPGSSKTRSSGSGKQPTLKRVKGENFYRDAKAASRLKMLNGGKPVRDRDGKIIQAAAFQKGEDETKPGRVQPDRRWFGEW